MLKSSPILSVILPVYNAEQYLEEAIESILNQSYSNFELLVADDASVDKSLSIIKKYSRLDSRLILFRNRKNLGKIAIVNRLSKLARGKYLTIHDADDYSAQSRFEKQIKFLEENSQFVMCGTSFITINERGEEFACNKTCSDYSIIKEKIRSQSQFHGPTMVFKSDAPDKIGGLFRIMKMGEDVDFSMRLVENFPAVNLPECLYYYRINSNSLTKSSIHDLQEKIIDRHLIYFFAEERRSRGSDSLMENAYEVVEEQRKVARLKYIQNKNHYLEEYVSYLLFYHLKIVALKFLIFQTLRSSPSIYKLRLIFYVLKKMVFGN